jgi:uncharacterized protein YbaP (TraB family)
MLWEISGNNIQKNSYIFGTFHTRDPNINKLPNIVISTLSQTQRLYTEIAMTHKSTNKILHFSKAIHPIPLKQRLHPKTIKILLKHLKTHKIPYTLNSLKVYKTWSIALMISNYAENTLYPNTEFMDENLASYAKDKHIKQVGLESPIEQLKYFDMLPSSLQEQLLLDTLAQDENDAYADALKAWYIKGTEKGFFAIQEEFISNNPKQQKLDKVLNEGLLIERNSRFLRRIDILLQSSARLSYFFAIGAGHMSGDKGIIQGLKRLGYRVKKLD